MRTIHLTWCADRAAALVQRTALAALAAAILVLPRAARADDGEDKASGKGKASPPAAEASAEASAETGFSIAAHAVSVTGGSEAPGAVFANEHHLRNAGILGAVTAGALFITNSDVAALHGVTATDLHGAAAGTDINHITNPEPTTVALLAAGLGMIGLVGRRKRGARID